VVGLAGGVALAIERLHGTLDVLDVLSRVSSLGGISARLGTDEEHGRVVSFQERPEAV